MYHLGRRLQRKKNPTAFDRLERQGNDDFHLLQELGPKEFSVEHLFELRHRAYDRLATFDKLTKRNTWIAVLSLVFVGAGGIAFNTHRLSAGICFLLALACILWYFGGIVWLRMKFNTRGELEHTLYEIEDELRRRMAIRPKKPRGL